MKRKTKRIILIIVGILVLAIGFKILFSKPNIPGMETMSLQEWIRNPSPVKMDGMKQTIKVATTSLQTLSDKDASVTQIIKLAEEIKNKEPDTRLIVFGEASLGLYFDSKEPNQYQKNIAETIPGNATDSLGKVAKKLSVYLAIGLIEKAGDTLYNSMVVFDTNGEIVAKHRKSLLHDYDVQNGITTAENNAPTFNIDNFKFGLSICADANSTKLVNAYKEEQIDGLIYSVTSNLPWFCRQMDYWPMAKKYNAWIIASNRYGKEGNDDYTGFIFIADNKGAMHKMKNNETGYITTVIGKN
ncbi:carbon-nitrogen hydrolase family protein [Flavobacterium sp. SUN046]|uniref:carbon-nitrogen hydrolase family protein n=1 Tax=Flavobacterium sp. SUN046 TaxID=3002440 RepID=UPI002DB59D14|nr:carbon-nitrogen hydrolase family protein [Flavobacterium sp. SUN046]MEC4048690.1 carbon-nitrogen hydrolase family protein [Flavobacterium sp. SUN046]